MEKILDRLAAEVGNEVLQDQAAYDLKFAVRELRAPAVGVHHVTCSDEAERETVETFQRCFVQDMAPRLKLGNRSAFRSANLGGVYEWGSLAIAEANFAGSQGDFKLMAVKINSHVGVIGTHDNRRFGLIDRYGRETPACGALQAFTGGTAAKYAAELLEQFSSEGVDRLAALKEVPETHRNVATAMVSARLQARSAAMEAQDHKPVTPTVYIIVPAVTLNQPNQNTEILCGVYFIDRRGSPRDFYRGLGDNPGTYVFTEEHSRLHVADNTASETRPARDHRRMVASKWRERGAAVLRHDPRIDKLLNKARKLSTGDATVAKGILSALLPLLAEVSPVTAALMLFTSGASGIYQVYRAHKLVEEVEEDEEARGMLADLESRLDHMPPEQAQKVLKVLLAAHSGKKK